jgi:shikimate kinase
MIESAGRALRDARRLSKCCILYLRAQPQTLVGRMTRADGDRPPLTGAAPDKEMEEMFSRRDAHFQLLADRVIETDALSPEQIADQIERELWPSREPGERGRPSNSG